jgi:hypothetical protein
MNVKEAAPPTSSFRSLEADADWLGERELGLRLVRLITRKKNISIATEWQEQSTRKGPVPIQFEAKRLTKGAESNTVTIRKRWKPTTNAAFASISEVSAPICTRPPGEVARTAVAGSMKSNLHRSHASVDSWSCRRSTQPLRQPTVASRVFQDGTSHVGKCIWRGVVRQPPCDLRNYDDRLHTVERGLVLRAFLAFESPDL